MINATSSRTTLTGDIAAWISAEISRVPTPKLVVDRQTTSKLICRDEKTAHQNAE
jgi:hypothetical protein